jgi:hypothetical protein
MPQLEQTIDRKLGIVDTNYAGQWSAVESAIDTKLGIEPEPEPTFEQKEKHIKDVFMMSDELELPYRTVLDKYDELQRQKKEFPSGKLQQGQDEFSMRELLRNLYDKVKPPSLGEASPSQIYWQLKEGFKGVGHIGTEYFVGKKTLGLADTLAAPIEAFNDVYLANRKLRKDLVSQGNKVTDVGTKYDPVWKIEDADGNVEFISPNTVADKKFASSVAELYDRIVGLEVEPHEKTFGEIAKVIGTFKGAANLRGPMPAHIGTLGKAGHAFQVGLIYGTATEARKGIVGDESYRGAIAVLEDGIILAALSLIGSGIGGIWQKLKPTEQSRALKLLGLKRGATEKEIAKASRKAFLQYHPDKVKGMQAEFEKAVKARNVLLNRDYGKDIIYRGRAPSAAKLLTGVTPEGVPIKPTKPPIKIEPEPVILAPEAPTLAEAEKRPPTAAVTAEKPTAIEPAVAKPTERLDANQIIKKIDKKTITDEQATAFIRSRLDEAKQGKVEGIDILAVGALKDAESIEPIIRRMANAASNQMSRVQAGQELLTPEKLAAVSGIDIDEIRGFLEGKTPAIAELTAPPTEAIEPTAEGKIADTEFIKNRWDGSKLGYRVELIMRGKWITNKGQITKSGEKYAQSKWDELSPAVQRVVKKFIAQDYNRQLPEAKPTPPPMAKEIKLTDAKVINEGYRNLKAKIGEKKTQKYFVQVDKLINPNTNAVVEYRENGVVTKDGKIYTFHALAGQDTKQWRIAFTTDVSDQFVAPVAKELPLTNKEFDKFSNELRPGFVDIEPYVDALKSAHDWTFTFGEAKRLNPELFNKLMESYGRRNAAVEKAISILKRVVPENLTAEEAMELAIIYEDKRLSPPEGLEETYKGFAGLLDKIEKRSLEEGIFQQTFQERMIAENEAQIDALRETLLSPSKSKRVAELIAENERLKQIRYLPHSIVARRTIEAKLAELKGEERKTYLESIARISAKFKKRTGKLFMKDYLDEGILKPGDIDIRRLTANALTDYYYRSALKDLFDYATEQELIKPTSDALRKQGWLNQQEMGIISPELKGKVVHPLLASSLSEMKEMKLGKGGGTIRQVLSMIKIGQFIKPSIIWTYNAIQAFMKGMYGLDPIKGQRLLADSFRAVIGKNALYHKLNEANLYQFPYEVSRGSIEEQIEQYIRQNSPEISRLTKLLEKTTDMTWKAEDLDLKKMIMVGHRALANLTWTGDRVQRTHSYLILRKMGYPHDEAVKVASHSHGAYSVLSERYKKFMSPITFVYSFRLLMPIEIAKILTEPLIGIPQAFFKKEPIPAYKWNRWVKSWVGAVAIPVLTDEYMKQRGFEKEGKHLGALAWKWKKTIVLDGKKQEIVVGINNILNMPVKYWNRITYYNPIRSEARWQQAINNLVKWEIHPLWRIFFWDIRENRKSFGTGVNIYNPNDNPIKQLGQTFLYVFGQSFRFWGGMMDAVGEGNMTEKEREAQEAVFDEGLNKLDKFLFTVFGYKYIRAPLKERQAIAMASLQKEMTRRMFNDAKRYKGKELEKQKADLKRWSKKCEQWIKKGMK